MIKSDLPKILLITTGGTITMIREEEGGLAPCHNTEILSTYVPELNLIAKFDILPVIDVDSSNIQPEFWSKLAQIIYDRMPNYDGIVVTHGTDTMAYTAAALSFMIQELPKPIVITGAQVPLLDIGSDGRINLINAFRVATLDIAEVVIVFGSEIIRGTRAKKLSAFDIQAFTTVNEFPLGTIGLTIKLHGNYHKRSKRKPLLQNSLDPNVAKISVYPGLKPEIIEYLASTHNGIVIEGYGAGNIPTEGNSSLCNSIAQATSKNIPVVICTQCIVGSTELELYNVGRAALKAGAIPAMDMTPETTLVKLMWLLAQTKDISKIESMMQKSFVGEVHEIT